FGAPHRGVNLDARDAEDRVANGRSEEIERLEKMDVGIPERVVGVEYEVQRLSRSRGHLPTAYRRALERANVQSPAPNELCASVGKCGGQNYERTRRGIAPDVHVGFVNPPQILRRQNFRGSSIRDRAAIGEQQHAIGIERGGIEIVKRRNYGHAALGAQLAKARENFRDVLEVEKCGRLVEQRDLRLLRERARQEHPLALAAGQLLHVAGGEPEKVEASERGRCDLQIAGTLETEGAEMRRAP